MAHQVWKLWWSLHLSLQVKIVKPPRWKKIFRKSLSCIYPYSRPYPWTKGLDPPFRLCLSSVSHRECGLSSLGRKEGFNNPLSSLLRSSCGGWAILSFDHLGLGSLSTLTRNILLVGIGIGSRTVLVSGSHLARHLIDTLRREFCLTSSFNKRVWRISLNGAFFVAGLNSGKEKNKEGITDLE